MITNIFKDMHYMKQKDKTNNIQSDNTYYNHTLRLLNDLLCLIDLDKTTYKVYKKQDTIIFLLSYKLYIALSFSDNDYIIFINFNNCSENLLYTKEFIDNSPKHFIDIFTNIKCKIDNIKLFLDNIENPYIKSLKSVFMRTY